MLANINLNLLRTLLVVLEECHVSRAADKLNLTQSAVSRQLSQLRELCHDPLLVRSGNQLVPTPRAQQIKQRLGPLLLECGQVLQPETFSPEHWQGSFTFASSDYVAQHIWPHVTRVIQNQAPQLDLNFQLWKPADLSDHLGQSIELASTMLAEAPKQYSYFKIGEDHPVCLMSRSHPLAEQADLSLQGLLEHSHIMVTGGGDKDSALDNALHALGKTRRIALKVPFFNAAVHCLLGSEHLMVVPEHIAKHLSHSLPVTFKPLPLETQLHKYWLVWHPKFDQDLAHRWLREEVREVMLNIESSIGFRGSLSEELG